MAVRSARGREGGEGGWREGHQGVRRCAPRGQPCSVNRNDVAEFLHWVHLTAGAVNSQVVISVLRQAIEMCFVGPESTRFEDL